MPGSLESEYIHIYIRAIQKRAPSDYTSRSRAAAPTHARIRARVDRPTTRTHRPGLVILTFWEFHNRNGSSRRAFDVRFAIVSQLDAIFIVRL